MLDKSRYDPTDFEWCVIEPLLPNKPRGVARGDDRRVLNGILWVQRSGANSSTATVREPLAKTASCDGGRLASEIGDVCYHRGAP